MRFRKNFPMKILSFFCFILFCAAVSADTDFFDFKSHPALFAAARRKQNLTFLPEKNGADRGIWRITCTEKGKQNQRAELILKKEIPLPDFNGSLRVEMDLETEPDVSLKGVDLRLRDAKGEICSFNGLRKPASGNFTVVWILHPDQKVSASWGADPDKRLDLPAKITNIAFIMNKDCTGDLLIKSMRFSSNKK